MSAKAWRHRKVNAYTSREERIAIRKSEQRCTEPGCLRNRLPHAVHFAQGGPFVVRRSL